MCVVQSVLMGRARTSVKGTLGAGVQAACISQRDGSDHFVTIARLFRRHASGGVLSKVLGCSGYASHASALDQPPNLLLLRNHQVELDHARLAMLAVLLSGAVGAGAGAGAGVFLNAHDGFSAVRATKSTWFMFSLLLGPIPPPNGYLWRIGSRGWELTILFSFWCEWGCVPCTELPKNLQPPACG